MIEVGVSSSSVSLTTVDAPPSAGSTSICQRPPSVTVRTFDRITSFRPLEMTYDVETVDAGPKVVNPASGSSRPHATELLNRAHAASAPRGPLTVFTLLTPLGINTLEPRIAGVASTEKSVSAPAFETRSARN